MNKTKDIKAHSPADAMLPSGISDDVKGRRTNPPPEDEFGGGDLCSPEKTAPTEDDTPLP